MASEADEPIVDSFDRLGMLAVRGLLPGLAIAFGSLFSLVAISVVAPRAGMPCFYLFHGVFVAALANLLLAPSEGVQGAFHWRNWVAGAAMAAAIAPLALLDMAAGDYSCADGRIYGRSGIPPLPWFLIGWLLLNLSALPTRMLKRAHAKQLLWWPHRVLLTAPLAAPVFLIGWPFETKIFDCTNVEDGWGLFEGGLFLFPLLGLFLFAASFSTAVLAAAFLVEERD